MRKIKLSVYLDEETERYLDLLVDQEAKSGKGKNKAKAVRNAIRTYYNYLQYQKRRSEFN